MGLRRNQGLTLNSQAGLPPSLFPAFPLLHVHPSSPLRRPSIVVSVFHHFGTMSSSELSDDDQPLGSKSSLATNGTASGLKGKDDSDDEMPLVSGAVNCRNSLDSQISYYSVANYWTYYTDSRGTTSTTQHSEAQEACLCGVIQRGRCSPRNVFSGNAGCHRSGGHARRHASHDRSCFTGRCR